MQPAPLLPLQQHPSFADALRLLGQNIYVEDFTAAAPVVTLTRYGVRFASRGPIWISDTANEMKSKALHKSKIRLLNADIYDPDIYRAAGYRMTTTPASVAELTLSGTSETRLTAAKGKWRNAWRKAMGAPLVIKQERFDLIKHNWLLNADMAQQRMKRFRALPHSLILAFAQRRPKDVLIYVAHHKKQPIAAMLYLRHHPVATYHLGWSNDLGRQFCAHHRLLLHAADDLAAQGYLRMDLGPVDTENTPGLARFKIGSGATVRQLGGTWLKLPGF